MYIMKKMMKLMSGEDEDDKFLGFFFPESVTFLTEIDGRTNVADRCQSQWSFL